MALTIPTLDLEQELYYKEVGDRKVRLLLQLPRVRKYEKAPVYLIIPGGGWAMAEPESMIGMSRVSVDYARDHGWAVASLAYRIIRHDPVDMEQIVSDCMDAGRYLAHYAQKLGLDMGRVVTSGHSAGGHLALMMALAPQGAFVRDSVLADPFRVVACAPLSPPTVLYQSDTVPQTLAFSMDQLLPGTTLEEWKRYSPVDWVNARSVPCRTFAGTHDDLVFPLSSELLVKAYEKAGAECEAVYAQNGGHCFECKVPGAKVAPDALEIQKMLCGYLDRFAPEK